LNPKFPWKNLVFTQIFTQILGIYPEFRQNQMDVRRRQESLLNVRLHNPSKLHMYVMHIWDRWYDFKKYFRRKKFQKIGVFDS
jgi:hypothetical protein